MNDCAAPAKPNRKRRWLKIALVAVVLLACLYAGYRYTLHRMVEAKLDAIRKQGCPVTLAELDRCYPTPPGDNAAPLLEEAGQLIKRPKPPLWDLVPIAGAGKVPPPGEPLPDNQKQAIAQYLNQHSKAIELLHKAGAMKAYRFPIDLQQGFAIPLSRLSQVKEAASLLEVETFYYVAQNEPELAARSLFSAFGIAAHALRSEPLLISQLVRIAVIQISISSLRWTLNRISFSDQQLAQLSDSLLDAEDQQAMMRALVGERCFGHAGFQLVAKNNTAIGGFISWEDPPPKFSIRHYAELMQENTVGGRLAMFFYTTSGCMDLDRLAHLDIMSRYIAASQLPFPDRLKEAKAVASAAEALPQYRIFSNLFLLPVIGLAIDKDARNIAYLRCAATALAVERYRLANSRLPDKLDDLVPAYFKTVPLDPFDGNPLRYKKLERGYVVYSIGSDGVDNSGAEKGPSGQQYEPGSDIPFKIER